MRIQSKFIKACFVFFIVSITGCKSEKDIYKGYIEAEYQYVAPTTSGVLKSVYVQRGSFIKKGEPLFALDDVELKAAIESAKAFLRQTDAVLREDEKDYQRALVLLKSKTISQADFEKKESDYKSSKAKLDAAKQSLLAAEERLKDSAPVSENSTYVEDVFFAPGEFVSAGKPVVSLLNPHDVKVRFFVPQSELIRLKEGHAVMIWCDGCAQPRKARITYIAKRAEYTPPVIYSTESRQKMVFMVEAKSEDLEPMLHPGLPVDIEILAQ